MRRRNGWVLAMGLAACGGGPAAAPQPPPAEPPKAASDAPIQRPPSEDERAFVAAAAPWIQSVRDALAKCHKLLDLEITPEDMAVGMPFGAALADSCDDLGAAYDKALETRAGHDRATDVLLTHLARAADDLDFVRRSRDEIPDQRRTSLQHARGALKDVASGLSAWGATSRSSYAEGAVQVMAGAWPMQVLNDGRDLPELREHFEHLAFNQGFDKEQVRHRMLASWIRVAAEPVKAALAAVDTVPQPEEREARRAYLQACEAYLATYTSVLNAFAEGRVPNAAVHAERVGEADSALHVWKGVWEREKERVDALPQGGPPGSSQGAPQAPK